MTAMTEISAHATMVVSSESAQSRHAKAVPAAGSGRVIPLAATREGPGVVCLVGRVYIYRPSAGTAAQD